MVDYWASSIATRVKKRHTLRLSVLNLLHMLTASTGTTNLPNMPKDGHKIHFAKVNRAP